MAAAAALTLAIIAGCGRKQDIAPHVPGTLITGRAMYEDRQYNVLGMTGELPLKPVRYALVEAVDPASSEVIATTRTGADGAYSMYMPVINSASAYVRLVADSRVESIAGALGIEVREIAAVSEPPLYAVTTGARPLLEGVPVSADLVVNTPDTPAGAFNILDVLTWSAEYALAHGAAVDYTLKAFWSPENSSWSGYCDASALSCPFGEGMYVLGGPVDTDDFDDDVLMHEFGHFITRRVSRDDSEGGFHFLTDNDLDLRLSWSEGFAGYYSAAVKAWLAKDASRAGLLSTTQATPTTLYVDTADGAASFYIDFMQPAWPGDPDVFIYSSNEIAIAKVLLGFANMAGQDSVWDVYSGLGACPGRVNLESFYEGWLTGPASDTLADEQAVLTERMIHYAEDNYETDGDNAPNPVRRILVGTEAQVHYLYRDDGAPDVDVAAFVAAPGLYSVETYCMQNGADTYLRVLDTDGMGVLGENADTPNSFGCGSSSFSPYASRAIVNIPAAGTYYAEVSADPAGRPSAGRFGTYTLRVAKH